MLWNDNLDLMVTLTRRLLSQLLFCPIKFSSFCRYQYQLLSTNLLIRHLHSILFCDPYRSFLFLKFYNAQNFSHNPSASTSSWLRSFVISNNVLLTPCKRIERVLHIVAKWSCKLHLWHFSFLAIHSIHLLLVWIFQKTFSGLITNL